MQSVPLRSNADGYAVLYCPQLVSCNVCSYQHCSVSLEFFETVVRYDKFFIVEPQHIPNVLVRTSPSHCGCVCETLCDLCSSSSRWPSWTSEV